MLGLEVRLGGTAGGAGGLIRGSCSSVVRVFGEKSRALPFIGTEV